MTDLRQLLADALRDENLKFRNGHLDGDEWCLATADILLSLPGIAIVELPEPEPNPPGWTTFGTAKAMLAETEPGLVGRPASLHWIKPKQARALAAALLAAANAAGSKHSGQG